MKYTQDHDVCSELISDLDMCFCKLVGCALFPRSYHIQPSVKLWLNIDFCGSAAFATFQFQLCENWTPVWMQVPSEENLLCIKKNTWYRELYQRQSLWFWRGFQIVMCFKVFSITVLKTGCSYAMSKSCHCNVHDTVSAVFFQVVLSCPTYHSVPMKCQHWLKVQLGILFAKLKIKDLLFLGAFIYIDFKGLYWLQNQLETPLFSLPPVFF